MKFRVKSIFSLIIFLFISISSVHAQSITPPAGPTYIISPGDSLLEIASTFNVSLKDIMTANSISDPDQIYPGDSIVIPGLEGISGTLVSSIVQFGNTERSISRQYRIPQSQLIRLNRLISPTEFYAGAKLILVELAGQPAWTGGAGLDVGESLLEFSIINGTDPYTVSTINYLPGSWSALPGDILFHTGNETNSSQIGLPPVFLQVSVNPLPIVQGATAQIRIKTTEEVTLGGKLIDQELHFFPEEGGSQVALQGVHVLTDPGLYKLRLDADFPDGRQQSFEQMILIETGNYPTEVLYVDPRSIDPAITKPEEDLIHNLVKEATPEKYWHGSFVSPASQYESTSYLTSKFGNRRTYFGIGTDLEIHGFHSGLDFGGGTGLPIVTPAAGVVVFAGPLDIRGNATIINHGWGIYSGFWHQSKIEVQPGDFVDAGQLIGLVGGTGRATGAHLHWEIWVNGIQVNPMDWLESEYPIAQ